jgi:hypothetical protein
MTSRLIYILTILTSTAFGQQSTTDTILEIIRTALADKQLPKELVNNVDSLKAIQSKREYTSGQPNYPLTVGIEGTKENGLKTGQHIKWDDKEIWIWGVEDFFLFDIYWMTPTNIIVKGRKISFEFVTHTWGDKNYIYYKGTVKAEKINDKWIVRTTKLTETTNNFAEWDKARPKSIIRIKD